MATPPSTDKPPPWPKGTDKIPQWYDELPGKTQEEFRKQFESTSEYWGPTDTPKEKSYKKKKRGHKNDPFYAQSQSKVSRRSERDKMANKFLPFIVESSTPLHIFKTLLTRSKGMNDVLVASTFRLVLSIDIKTLREQSKEMPEMPLEKIYEELLIKHPQCRIEDTDIQRILSVFKWLPKNPDTNLWHLELDQFERKDIALFLCGLYLSDYEGETYTAMPFYDIIKNLHDFDAIYGTVQDYVKFSDTGETVMFLDEGDLKGFVLYHAFLRESVDPDGTTTTYNARFAIRVEKES